MATERKEPYGTGTAHEHTRRHARQSRRLEAQGTIIRPGAQRNRQTRRVVTPSPARGPGSATAGPGAGIPHPADIKKRQAVTPRLTSAYNPPKFLLQPLFQQVVYISY
jgi:hypothetical protein